MKRSQSGGPQPTKALLEWFMKAAKHDYVEVQALLGASYWDGRGVAQSYVEAAKWLYEKLLNKGKRMRNDL